MKKIVLDSSVIIEHLRFGKGFLSKLLKIRNEHATLLIPTVVVMEIETGKSMDDKSTQLVTRQLLDQFIPIELSVSIAQLSGELVRHAYAQGYDAVIAATSLLHDAELATLNRKHFIAIPGLKLYDIS